MGMKDGGRRAWLFDSIMVSTDSDVDMAKHGRQGMDSADVSARQAQGLRYVLPAPFDWLGFSPTLPEVANAAAYFCLAHLWPPLPKTPPWPPATLWTHDFHNILPGPGVRVALQSGIWK